jgi:Na+/melibiose symporter-like transporter
VKPVRFDRLPAYLLLAYGSLALPLCLAEIPIILYLPAFYARELRIGAGLVGTIFLLARLWDGLSDILVGWLSDRSTSRFGRRRPWIILGAPFLMVSTWFLCNPPKSVGFGYLALWAALFYTAFTAVKIPHLSWGTELATDYVERSRVTTFRESFTMIGSALFVSLPLLFLGEAPQFRQVLWLIAISVLASVPVAVAALWRLVPDPAHTVPCSTPLLRDLTALRKDGIFTRFVTARFLFALEEGVTNSLLAFSFSVGLALTNREFFWVILVLYVATLCAMPNTLRLAARVEKHILLAGGVAVQAVVYAVILAVRPNHLAVVMCLYAVIGVVNTAMLSLPTSILADIIDVGELRWGDRRSGTYVAVDNLLYKIGLALGVGLSFGLLALVGFDPSASAHDRADVRHILLLGFGLPSVLSIPVVVLYLTHPITRALQQKLRAKITERDADGGLQANTARVASAASLQTACPGG